MSPWLGVAAAACSVCALCGCRAAYRGPVSDHFDGRRFFDPERGGHSLRDTLRWFWEMETLDWPEWIDDPPRPAPPARVGKGALRVTYVNHATVLVQIDGLNVLTDPILSKRAGPTAWLGTKRVRAPGVKLAQLPPIDVVLVSHDHYDHLDLPTIRQLARRDHPRFLVGLGVGRQLRSEGVPDADVVELDWWQSAPPVGDVRFTFVPARHGSGRGPFTAGKTLWGGFAIDAPGGQVYFAGDTALGAFVREVAARFPRIRLALLPIGSYEKRWIMKTQHMNPDDAASVHGALRAARSMGIHYATFAEHPEQTVDQHEKDLAAALALRGIAPDRFWILGFGEGREVPPVGSP